MELFTQKCPFLKMLLQEILISKFFHIKEKDMEYMLIIAVIYRGE